MIYFFLKFSESKYLDDLLNGNLFFNKVDYFRKLEKENGIRGMGDQKELSLSLDGTTLLVGERKHILIIKTGQFKYDFTNNLPMFCMCAITENSYIKTQNKLVLREDLIDKCCR